jgi:ankyrin repeat protein
MALVEAAMTGDVEAATEAVAAGACVNWANVNHITPLMIATGGMGPLPMVRLLIAAGADVNTSDRGGWTPVLNVASTGQAALLPPLAEAGARLLVAAQPATTAPGAVLTPFPASSSAGGDVDGDSDGAVRSGWTPLSRAAYKGHAAMVAALLDAAGGDATRVGLHVPGEVRWEDVGGEGGGQ